MARLVQKFGGTSVADLQLIRNAAEIAVGAVNQGYEVAAVVSAMGHTTDNLISLAEQMSPQPSPRELDMLLTTGEQVSIALMSLAIQSLGRKARSFTGAQAGIVTEHRHGCARIVQVNSKGIEESLSGGEIAVVAGFQGISERNEITTLGRGGSDTTAVALAAALGADRCDIYTDVNGVYTADPRLLSEVRLLKLISYEEMLELANVGAQVVNPQAVELAMVQHVPVRVRSTFKPDDLGTLVTHRQVTPDCTLLSIACDMNQVCFTLTMPAVEARTLEAVSNLFIELKRANINTDMIVLISREDESSQELVFTVDKKVANQVRAFIDTIKIELGKPAVNAAADLARISIVGFGLSSRPSVVAAIFETLCAASIPVQMVASGDIRVSALIPAYKARDAIKLIHQRLQL